MVEGSLISEEARALVGKETEPISEEVTKQAIRQYARAIAWPDVPDPLYVDEEYAKKTRYGGIIAPPTFYTNFRTTQIEVPLPPAQVGMNAGNDYESFQPIRPGDVITCKTKLTDLTERTGRSGKLIISTSETTFTNQKGEMVGIYRGTGIWQY